MRRAASAAESMFGSAGMACPVTEV